MPSGSSAASLRRNGGGRAVRGGIPSFNGVGDGAEVSNSVGAGVAFFVVPPSATAAAVALALALAAQRNGAEGDGDGGARL